MVGYWLRHRLVISIIVCVAASIVVGALFVYPYIKQRADDYNAQSIYKKSEIDFVAPEPSFEQVAEVEGTHGIDKVFPYYLTKTQVTVNGKVKETTVLLSDQFQNVDITMYCEERLIKKAARDYDSPIYVDWQFANSFQVNIGDTVSFSIASKNMEFTVAAIYETNSLFNAGTVLAKIGEETKTEISQLSQNNGYSGMFVKASEYGECQKYLTTEYRPLGRLKDRELFDDDNQYQIHYDAIMSAGYANEITDLRIREKSLETKDDRLLLCIGAVIFIVVLVVFNGIMRKRGCEETYFQRNCIPKGKNVMPFYSTAFIFELLACILCCAAVVIYRIYTSDFYIVKSVYDGWIAIVPASVFVGESLCLVSNRTVVREAVRLQKEKDEKEKKMNQSNQEQSLGETNDSYKLQNQSQNQANTGLGLAEQENKK